ncbi:MULTISPECIES: phosphonate metabolism protein/1,5-bisphosphokinase (PRPP-forming) PhnN [unclassified Ruegeria]|uniref:phosphonate metabolism protein/1,5-bisphosphokinase (PRPP-forming) PhnN n=1 Tax=unclassified Ruegeria TaxID=2625375 RepID=UPI0014877B8A|nr:MULTISPECIES: phosphonate metabolism protein/1,5-bisphosphokinase (PRPP-forming) PhnN [unclassified Ruegeria]NOD36730.1 phosphonate metabolism protein/1,5-bisphosphokinase (PRPP-forming) PhnN [Ruegeria sp. HKCCD7296]NOE36191.1 phosphonate metabolism protein/1,5-bisphosphokinase (PRPP-forming) PhnN [Ruegeria sp. HKCCD7318]NOE42553.1 phosphonate metabolism protein/1,5-bisphosphokinase (PRPP-forming) PhnN [Ruegeria sp. HKCCD7319]
MTLAPVIAVVGPSGVGKDSVMQALVAQASGIQRLRRVITRPEGEEGEDFDRVSVATFQQMERAGAFALSWPAHGLFYGVPTEITRQRNEADAVLVNLSRKVLVQAQEVFGDLIVISLTAEADVLAQRLSARGRESATEQARRLGRAKAPLPDGLNRVIEVDNSGALEDTVAEILAQLQPESA